eukprot:7087046-Lingulodinium_polyedra.AAC.1
MVGRGAVKKPSRIDPGFMGKPRAVDGASNENQGRWCRPGIQVRLRLGGESVGNRLRSGTRAQTGNP